jgi:enoyl-CoA hydratase
VRIEVSRDGGVARLTMDDGKANAFDLRFFDELDSALDECGDADAIVIAGRAGMFSGGLNLKVLQSLSADGLLELLTRFGHTMHRVWLEPRPVVAAATGHAVAGGTILCMATDYAVASAGDYRWGLNETAIGMVMPEWILAIARANLRADRFEDLILTGALISAEEAVEAGFADVALPTGEVVDHAMEKATSLAALPRQAYAATKQRLRGAASRSSLAVMDADLRGALGLS